MEIFDQIDQILNEWQKSVLEYFPKILLAFLLLLIFYFAARLVRKLAYHLSKKYFPKYEDITSILATVAYVIFMLSGFFLALEVLGLDSVLSKILAGAGVIGIIAGIAFRDIAANVFAGLLLNMQRPFRLHDWVTINESFGTVRKIGWITTSIKTLTGQEVFVPNQLIYNTTFTNFSTFHKRLIVLKTGVSYGDDLEFVKQVALEEIAKIDKVLTHEKIDFFYTEIGDFSFNFEIRFWIKFIKQSDYLEAMSDAIMHIKKRFEDENISIAFPVQTLDFGGKGTVKLSDIQVKVRNESSK